MKINDILSEGKVHRNDPAMDEVYDKDKDMDDVGEAGAAPYYVSWHGQSHEWYGDGDPSEGNGRYKSKGDGGQMLAVNIPTYAEAEAIKEKAEQKIGKAVEKAAKTPHPHYWISGFYVHIGSMKDMSSMDKLDMKYDKPADISKGNRVKYNH